jgi:hypothetical protein
MAHGIHKWSRYWRPMMKAWRLEKLGGRLSLEDIPVPEPRPGSVLVRVEASALMSYLKAYVEGKLPFYNPPAGPFTIGTNASGLSKRSGATSGRSGLASAPSSLPISWRARMSTIRRRS